MSKSDIGSIFHIKKSIKYSGNTELKACTVGIYSTKESRYLYSLGDYISKVPFTKEKSSVIVII